MSDLTRVQLTDEEWHERARRLAQRLRDRELLVLAQQEARDRYNMALRVIDTDIRVLADVVRSGTEDRTEQIGLFP